MSNVQHAAAPWAAKKVDDDNLIRIKNADGGQVAICSNFSFFDTPETLPGKELVNEANARRIVACVNACDSDGLPTSALEALVAKGGRLKGADWYVDMLDRQLEQAEQQRDALLAALEAFMSASTEDQWSAAYDKAETAIAAAKGGAV